MSTNSFTDGFFPMARKLWWRDESVNLALSKFEGALEFREPMDAALVALMPTWRRMLNAYYLTGKPELKDMIEEHEADALDDALTYALVIAISYVEFAEAQKQRPSFVGWAVYVNAFYQRIGDRDIVEVLDGRELGKGAVAAQQCSGSDRRDHDPRLAGCEHHELPEQGELDGEASEDRPGHRRDRGGDQAPHGESDQAEVREEEP